MQFPFLKFPYLNALGKSLQLISWERNARLALRNQWNDGDSGMSTDHWAVDGIWVQSLFKRALLQWSVIAYSSLQIKNGTFNWPMKALARTTSRVVTPKIRLGSYTPAFLNTSLAMGTVLLTC